MYVLGEYELNTLLTHAFSLIFSAGLEIQWERHKKWLCYIIKYFEIISTAMNMTKSIVFTRGQFGHSGIVIASVCVCVCPSVCVSITSLSAR